MPMQQGETTTGSLTTKVLTVMVCSPNITILASIANPLPPSLLQRLVLYHRLALAQKGQALDKRRVPIQRQKD
jgi:hypothetical protein